MRSPQQWTFEQPEVAAPDLDYGHIDETWGSFQQNPHWKKVPPTPAKDPTEEEEEEELPKQQQAKKKTKKKKTQRADLFSGPAPKFVQAKSLKKRPDATGNRLPEDFGVSLNDLTRLFLVDARVKSVRTSSVPMDNPTMDENQPPDDDHPFIFDDGGYEPPPDDDAPSSFEEEGRASTASAPVVDLLSCDRLVDRHDDVQYAKIAKRVDVRKLKGSLWDRIQRSNPLAFSTAVADVANDAAYDSSVTMPFYFICLLHLCNERNLSLTDLATAEDLADFLINVDNASQTSTPLDTAAAVAAE